MHHLLCPRYLRWQNIYGSALAFLPSESCSPILSENLCWPVFDDFELVRRSWCISAHSAILISLSLMAWVYNFLGPEFHPFGYQFLVLTCDFFISSLRRCRSHGGSCDFGLFIQKCFQMIFEAYWFNPSVHYGIGFALSFDVQTVISICPTAFWARCAVHLSLSFMAGWWWSRQLVLGSIQIQRTKKGVSFGKKFTKSYSHEK